MKSIFLVGFFALLSTSAFAELIQCDQKASDGMTYILASSATPSQGIIISRNNAKGGTETIITTRANSVTQQGTLIWTTPSKTAIDWNDPANQAQCFVFYGENLSFRINDTAGTGVLYRGGGMIRNPNNPNCQRMEAFPPPPTQLTCHAI